MNVVLVDLKENWEAMLPLTYTRPISECRIGVLTISEKWQKRLASSVSHITAPHLADKYSLQSGPSNLYINSNVLPNQDIVEQIQGLSDGQMLVDENGWIAFVSSENYVFGNPIPELVKNEVQTTVDRMNHPWDIFSKNGQEIKADLEVLASNCTNNINESNRIVGDASQVFVEEGATINCAILNTQNGPIYIGKNAEVMEGAKVKGPFALGNDAVLKMDAKIYGATTIGPFAKVGGEINNSVIFGYSNKAHDGFLGNSVIGEWCNLGADTNNSNLKNNYAEVKMWNYGKGGFVNSGLQFCGLVMGDHSKCGINTMFNTGTVVGVSANIFGSGFPRNFIPSFAWGGAAGFTEYRFDKAMEVAEIVMQRRSKDLDEKEKSLLQAVYDQTQDYRNRFQRK